MRATFFSKSFLTSIFCGCSAAMATDAVQLPLGTTEPPPLVVQVPADEWSGVYLGGFGTAFTAFFDAGYNNIDANGFDGGIFAGFDTRYRGYVIGGEADIALSLTGGEISSAGSNFEKRINGSVRARAGIAVDQVLIYGTAGLALTGTDISSLSSFESETNLGWTVGGGSDILITESLFGRVEYRYTDYESLPLTLGSTTVSSGYSDHAVRAGLGVRF